jgi:maltose phosphorylase
LGLSITFEQDSKIVYKPYIDAGYCRMLTGRKMQNHGKSQEMTCNSTNVQNTFQSSLYTKILICLMVKKQGISPSNIDATTDKIQFS